MFDIEETLVDRCRRRNCRIVEANELVLVAAVVEYGSFRREMTEGSL